jgi:hypothetical protein
MPVELVTDTATIRLPEAVEPHPDLLALAILMTVRPWAARRLRLVTPVSPGLAEAVSKVFAIEMTNVDGALRPRQRGSRAGLAYSAGPDCLAAAVIMGHPMPLFHFTRVRHPRVPNRATHLRSDVQLRIVEEAGQTHELHICASDLEFLVRPFPTFAHWVTMGIGATLQADLQDLGALVFGRHIGGSYVHSGHRFDREADWDLAWLEVFAAAGLDLVVPTAGLSELTTPVLASEHDLFGTRRSCLLGSYERPCGACQKCLRKSLIDWYHGLDDFPSGIIETCSRDSKMATVFSNPSTVPQKHLFARVLAKAPDMSGTLLGPPQRMLTAPPEATDWVERFHPPGLEEYVPHRYRSAAEANLMARIPRMSGSDVRMVETWPEALVSLPRSG